MTEFTFPSFIKDGNVHTAFYSRSVCIKAYCSTDKKMASVTVLEFSVCGPTCPKSLTITEADFFEAYKQSKIIVESALIHNRITELPF